MNAAAAFCHGVASIIFRISFIFGAVVGDALDHDFGIVAAGKRALGISPIVFRLALVHAQQRPLLSAAITNVAWRVRGFFWNCEISRGINFVCFLANLNKEFFSELSVGKAGES